MTENLDPRVDRAVNELKRPVPIAAGLASRARRRARRRVITRVASGGAVLALAVFLTLAERPGGSGTAVTFAINAPAVRSVALVGDFNDWRSDRIQLERGSAGQWRATLKLRPGRYRFAYVVDRAEWRADDHAASAPDDFGRPTSVLTVAGN